MSDVTTILWQTVASAGGLLSFAQLGRSWYLARSDRRAKDAGTGKTTAEAVTNLSGVAIQLLASAPKEIERLALRLAEAEEKIVSAENRIDNLNHQLRQRTREVEAVRAELDHLNTQLTNARIELAELRRLGGPNA